jgi:hypothetical protein
MDAHTMTLARHYAKQSVKAEYHKRGVRWRDLDARQLRQEANQFLQEHFDELVARAALLTFVKRVKP